MSTRALAKRATRALRRRAAARSREAGAVAVIVALFSSVLFFALAAIGVDAARWAVEVEGVQKAADAAALAGVTFVPYDMTNAEATALAVASRNGYKPDSRTKITIQQGSKPSQLRVTISSLVDNQFGRIFGVDSAWITRTAVADYTGPAPMGSPCNTFGNEPPSQPNAAQPSGSALPASPFPNCSWTSSKQPQFWAAMNGPDTGKVQGDRYMSRRCSGSPLEFGCGAAGANANSEYNQLGYFYAIHVEPAAVGKPLDIQIYDPAYVAIDASADTAACSLSFSTDSVNQYTTTDGKKRYSDDAYCTGDFQQSGGSGEGPVTSFALREQTDTNDPMKASLVSSSCIKQFGQTAMTSSKLTTALKRYTSGTTKNADYNPQLAQVFHQWVSLCTFTPTRKGDYYLHVRTNVALGGTAVPNASETGKTFDSIIYTGNTAAGGATGNLTKGVGLNAFAIRAVPQPLTDDATRKQISVSGFERMPIYQNATGSTATFNLIRVLPNARGQYIAFDFFDAADASSGSGTVTVTAPSDATGSVKSGSGVPNCKSAVNSGTMINLTGCKASVSSSQNNGQVQHMVVPIPNDYNCDYSTLGGCWFQVKISFGTSSVTDFTTWDANINGDPVRLVE